MAEKREEMKSECREVVDRKTSIESGKNLAKIVNETLSYKNPRSILLQAGIGLPVK